MSATTIHNYISVKNVDAALIVTLSAREAKGESRAPPTFAMQIAAELPAAFTLGPAVLRLPQSLITLKNIHSPPLSFTIRAFIHFYFTNLLILNKVYIFVFRFGNTRRAHQYHVIIQSKLKPRR